MENAISGLGQAGREQSFEDNWKHRSKGMRCKTCVYFVIKESMREFPEGLEIGRCRSHAPTMNGWPVMRSGDWCGDHKFDENKA